MRHLATPLVVALAVIAACGSDGSHPQVDPAGEPVRTAFNQAAGKVRAIFLAAPT